MSSLSLLSPKIATESTISTARSPFLIRKAPEFASNHEIDPHFHLRRRKTEGAEEKSRERYQQQRKHQSSKIFKRCTKQHQLEQLDQAFQLPTQANFAPIPAIRNTMPSPSPVSPWITAEKRRIRMGGTWCLDPRRLRTRCQSPNPSDFNHPQQSKRDGGGEKSRRGGSPEGDGGGGGGGAVAADRAVDSAESSESECPTWMNGRAKW